MSEHYSDRSYYPIKITLFDPVGVKKLIVNLVKMPRIRG